MYGVCQADSLRMASLLALSQSMHSGLKQQCMNAAALRQEGICVVFVMKVFAAVFGRWPLSKAILHPQLDRMQAHHMQHIECTHRMHLSYMRIWSACNAFQHTVLHPSPPTPSLLLHGSCLPGTQYRPALCLASSLHTPLHLNRYAIEAARV